MKLFMLLTVALLIECILAYRGGDTYEQENIDNQDIDDLLENHLNDDEYIELDDNGDDDEFPELDDVALLEEDAEQFQQDNGKLLEQQDAKPWGRRRRRWFRLPRIRIPRRRRRWFRLPRIRIPSCSGGPSTSTCSVARYNECGTGFIARVRTSILYKNAFTKACNKHDICYSCGKAKGWSQWRCDQKFKSDIDSICRCKYSSLLYVSNRLGCHSSALSFYALVRALGKNHYSQGSTPSFCSASCINQFSPSKPLNP